MSPLAQRVDVAEDRFDRIERMVERFAADTARFRVQAERDREERARELPGDEQAVERAGHQDGHGGRGHRRAERAPHGAGLFGCGEEQLFAGIYALARGDEAMQVLNLDAVRGRPARVRP